MTTVFVPDTTLPPDAGPLVAVLGLFSCCLYVLGFAFWVWMLVDCISREPERWLWVWLVFLLNIPGALIYFFVRWLPRRRLRPPRFMGRWVRRREILRAEADARSIGNAHQFVLLGDVLRETGRHERAVEAYGQAIAKEPDSLQALWGAGTAERRLGRLEQARDRLGAVMRLDPDYKFGDASLAYARTLVDLEDYDTARIHLEAHLQRRSDPEATILLASVHAAQDRPAEARALLEPLVTELRAARDARNRRARSDATRLLRKLPR